MPGWKCGERPTSVGGVSRLSSSEDLYHGRKTSRIRRIPLAIRSGALRKLDMVNAAHLLDDLRAPPGNRLEALRGDRQGWHSIRVNDQWRIVFRWQKGAAHEVLLEDYHRG